MKYIFSGHESFPCKTLWLKKGYDFVVRNNDFNNPEAVIDLGVGKNMVASIRYWLKVFGICQNDQPTWLGNYLFNDENGRDPFTRHELIELEKMVREMAKRRISSYGKA